MPGTEPAMDKPEIRVNCLPCDFALLDYLALEFEHAWRQLVVLGLEQEGIEPPTMIDRLERIGRDPQPDLAAEGVGDQRDIPQVGEEPPLGLDIGVAHFVADQRFLTGQIATP